MDRQPWVQMLTQMLTCFVTLEKSLKFSEHRVLIYKNDSFLSQSFGEHQKCFILVAGTLESHHICSTGSETTGIGKIKQKVSKKLLKLRIKSTKLHFAYLLDCKKHVTSCPLHLYNVQGTSQFINFYTSQYIKLGHIFYEWVEAFSRVNQTTNEFQLSRSLQNSTAEVEQVRSLTSSQETSLQFCGLCVNQLSAAFWNPRSFCVLASFLPPTQISLCSLPLLSWV